MMKYSSGHASRGTGENCSSCLRLYVPNDRCDSAEAFRAQREPAYARRSNFRMLASCGASNFELGVFQDENFDAVSSGMSAATLPTLLDRKTPTSKNHENPTLPALSHLPLNASARPSDIPCHVSLLLLTLPPSVPDAGASACPAGGRQQAVRARKKA